MSYPSMTPAAKLRATILDSTEKFQIERLGLQMHNDRLISDMSQ